MTIMKCPHCGKDHPNTAKYCENTGKKIESPRDVVICQNPDCDYRKPLPSSTKFCPNCGRKILDDTNYTRQTGREEYGSYVIIAYTRKEDDDLKEVDVILKDGHESFVAKQATGFASLCDPRYIRKGNEFIRIEEFTGWGEHKSFIEISKTGIRKGLSWDETRKDVEDPYGEGPVGFRYQEAPSKNPLNPYVSIKTKKRYSNVTDNFLLVTYIQNGGTFIDIFDRESERCLYKNIFISNYELHPDTNSSFLIKTYGWQGCGVANNEDEWVQLMINNEHCFNLDSNEMPVDNSMYDPTWKTDYVLWHFASEERILTVIQDGEYIPNYEDIHRLRMRDKKGKILKTIDATGLFLKSNFKFGRCLAAKTKNGRSWLVYIDEDGVINDIPNTSFNCSPIDLNCFFVTKDTLVIEDDTVEDEDGYCDYDNYARLIDINGNVIYHCMGLNELSEGIVQYYEGGRYGVVDYKGAIVLEAKYDWIDAI